MYFVWSICISYDYIIKLLKNINTKKLISDYIIGKSPSNNIIIFFTNVFKIIVFVYFLLLLKLSTKCMMQPKTLVCFCVWPPNPKTINMSKISELYFDTMFTSDN